MGVATRDSGSGSRALQEGNEPATQGQGADASSQDACCEGHSSLDPVKETDYSLVNNNVRSRTHIPPTPAMSMTKRDIVVAISSETGLVQQDVAKVVQRTLEIIREAVSHGKTVELRNFGVFEVKVRKARIGRNPNAPERDVRIPPRSVVKFKPGKEMRDEVLKLSPDRVEGASAPAPTPTPEEGEGSTPPTA